MADESFEEFEGADPDLELDTSEDEDVELSIKSPRDLDEDEALESALEGENQGIPYPGDGEFPPETEVTAPKIETEIIEAPAKDKLSAAENMDKFLPPEFKNTPELADSLRRSMIGDRSLNKSAGVGFADQLKGEHWSDLAEAKGVLKRHCRGAGTYCRHELRLESEAVLRYCSNEDEKPTRTVAVAICAVVITIGGMILAGQLGAPLWVTVSAVLLWSLGVIAVLVWSLRSFNRERLRIAQLRLYHQLRLVCLSELVKEDKKAKEDEERRRKEEKQRQMDERDANRKPYQLEPLA